jgi:hypothetical protein
VHRSHDCDAFKRLDAERSHSIFLARHPPKSVATYRGYLLRILVLSYAERRQVMSCSISTLLLRNLDDVFGENDPARRRKAIDEIFGS